MKIHTLEQEQLLPITLDQAWDFFSAPRNLSQITPPDIGFKIVHQPGERMYDGQIIVYKIQVPPGVWVDWVTEIRAVKDRESFIDEQLHGPYRFWHHYHTFEETKDGVLMRDLVHYALPFWPVSEIVHSLYVRKKLRQIFDFRKSFLARHFAQSGCGVPPQ
ncbi:MAG: SRPBCC family protein [Luteolibacter sp.]